MAARAGLVARTVALRGTEEVSVEFAPPPGWAAGAPPAPPIVSRQADTSQADTRPTDGPVFAAATGPAPASEPPDLSSGSGVVTAAAPSGTSAEQLERLAKDLYDKVRDELRSELRLDRDRAGLLTRLAR